MTTVSKQWENQARYDLETAAAMFEAGRLLYVLFCCQQALEKMLKGLIAKRTRRLPARLHNLMRLADLASLEVPEDTASLFRELTVYYIQSRYPEEIEAAGNDIAPELALAVLNRTEEAFQWLSSIA